MCNHKRLPQVNFIIVSSCQVVLPKNTCRKLSFVDFIDWSQFESSSQFETSSQFQFCNSSSCVIIQFLSEFEICHDTSFVTIWVICNLSTFEIVTIRFFSTFELSQICCQVWRFVKIQVLSQLEFHQQLRLSQFQFVMI